MYCLASFYRIGTRARSGFMRIHSSGKFTQPLGWLQGTFSHSLAEYALTSCLYFAKCIPQLQANQRANKWEPLYVEELR